MTATARKRISVVEKTDLPSLLLGGKRVLSAYIERVSIRIRAGYACMPRRMQSMIKAAAKCLLSLFWIKMR